MLIKNKNIFFLKHIFEMAVKSNSRLVLSMIGFVVGIFIFSLGNILLDSYYLGMIEQINDMSDESVVLELATDNINIIDKINTLSNYNCIQNSVSIDNPLIYYKKINDNMYSSMTGSMVGMSSMDNVVLEYYRDRYKIAGDVKLLKGRLLNENDNAFNNKVVVIDEFTEKLLFPKGDSIGKNISVNIDVEGVATVSTDKSDQSSEKYELTVVGVISNLYNSKKMENQYKKLMLSKSNNILLDTTLYCPLSIIKEKKLVDDSSYIFVWNLKDKATRNQILDKIERIYEIYRSEFNEFSITTRKILINEAIEELKPIKLFINAIMILLLLISGISIMSVMFFSIKERVPEIGIKKACGAKSIDILIQFVLEGIFIALLSSIIAVFFSIVVSIIIQAYIQNSLFILFNLNLDISKVLVPIFMSIIFGFIFSLIPSYYGSKISITEALRFD